MRQTLKTQGRFQRGAIAVEAAIVLPLLVIFVAFPSLSWALYFYNYSAAHKAVHDAALYLSTAPMLEMTTADPDGNPIALTLANKIIAKDLAGFAPPTPSIVCSYQQSSGFPLPSLCTVKDNKSFKQPLVGFYVKLDMSYVDLLLGSEMLITPYANVPYTGD